MNTTSSSPAAADELLDEDDDDDFLYFPFIFCNDGIPNKEKRNY